MSFSGLLASVPSNTGGNGNGTDTTETSSDVMAYHGEAKRDATATTSESHDTAFDPQALNPYV